MNRIASALAAVAAACTVQPKVDTSPASITPDKLAPAAVGTDALADGAVTGAKIAAATIEARNLKMGEGSMLDADTLDGIDSKQFVRTDAAEPQDGSVRLKGDAKFLGTLGASGAATLGGKLFVAGDAAVGGALSAASLTSTGTLASAGDATLGGKLAVTGDATLAGKLGVTGDATVSGALRAASVTSTGWLASTGDATVGGKLSVGGGASFGGGISTGGTVLLPDCEALRSGPTGAGLVGRCSSDSVIQLGSGNPADTLAFAAGGVRKATLDGAGTLTLAAGGKFKGDGSALANVGAGALASDPASLAQVSGGLLKADTGLPALDVGMSGLNNGYGARLRLQGSALIGTISTPAGAPLPNPLGYQGGASGNVQVNRPPVETFTNSLGYSLGVHKIASIPGSQGDYTSIAITRTDASSAGQQPLQNAESIGALRFGGSTSATTWNPSAAGVFAQATGAWSAASTPTDLYFQVTAPGAGAAAPTEAMRLTSTGAVGIGVSTPRGSLDVGGPAQRFASGGGGGSFTVTTTPTIADGGQVDLASFVNPHGVLTVVEDSGNCAGEFYVRGGLSRVTIFNDPMGCLDTVDAGGSVVVKSVGPNQYVLKNMRGGPHFFSLVYRGF